MDDGEVELSDPAFKGSASVESIIDEFFKHTKTCTHTHTCNPPGPDATTHTHTCFHTHTQVFSSGEDTKTHSGNSSLKPRKPLGNREAVRKYREKKKAHTAYLEEEVKKLRFLNQQLVRKLQGQAALEAELLRLRALFVELGGKIDIELGSFPFLKHCGSNPSISFKEGDCEAQIQCFHSIENGSLPPDSCGGAEKVGFSWGANCEPPIVDCNVNGNGSDHQLEATETMVSTQNQGQ